MFAAIDPGKAFSQHFGWYFNYLAYSADSGSIDHRYLKEQLFNTVLHLQGPIQPERGPEYGCPGLWADQSAVESWLASFEGKAQAGTVCVGEIPPAVLLGVNLHYLQRKGGGDGVTEYSRTSGMLDTFVRDLEGGVAITPLDGSVAHQVYSVTWWYERFGRRYCD
jgi:hypothetical protein